MTQQRGRLTPAGVNNRCWIQLFYLTLSIKEVPKGSGEKHGAVGK